MPYSRDKPYNDLPKLPPHGIDLETKAVLKQTIPAGRALAELKGAGRLIPNQAILIGLIGLQEAKVSSEIENIVTTNDELYRAFSEHDDADRHDPQTKEVLHYNNALWWGYDQCKNGRILTTRLFEDIVKIIKKNETGVRKITGTFIANEQREAVYTPPDGEQVIRDLLANVENFIHGSPELDPLVKMAVLHYQFEAIHPFSDGNGRTGRILNILYLVSEGLLDIPVLYLSRYIIEHKSEYYSGLRSVTENGDWENWILFMLKAVEETAIDTHHRILTIRDLMESVQMEVKDKLPKIYSKDLIEVLFAQPYCKIRFLTEAGIGNRQTAAKYLQELTTAGVLRRVDAGREAYFINTRFMNYLRG